MEEISVNDLKKTFGNIIAVDIPEFKISEGDFLGLVGNNGAGKTTFLRLLLDLAKADSGSISLFGIDPTTSEEWKSTTGAYLDDAFLIDFLTPEEYFEFVAKVNGLSKDELNKRLSTFQPFMNDEILGKDKYIRSFSAGNKQKIGIIAAMINHPRLLILDEPFNFLDPSSQVALKELLTDYHRSANATIILSSHNLQHVVDISSRIVIMEKGVFVKDLINNNGDAKAELESYFE